jgi:hypothetical protein
MVEPYREPFDMKKDLNPKKALDKGLDATSKIAEPIIKAISSKFSELLNKVLEYVDAIKYYFLFAIFVLVLIFILYSTAQREILASSISRSLKPGVA